MQSFPCLYLGSQVELTDERQSHIALTHPDLLPEYLAELQQTVGEPDQVRRSGRMSTARVFYRWFENVRQGKYIAVVVISETVPSTRHWIITAYITRRIAEGEIEWAKS